MTVSSVPRWMRALGPDVRALPAGRWWDAVRVPLDVGTAVLQRLGEQSGAVIADGYGGILYWLVPPRSAGTWELPGAQILGPGCHVAVPPTHRISGPGLYWLVPPTRERNWTSPERLEAALRASLTVR
ncbi:hypothetical protein [Streptomyces cavernae]|uniref:hypothetical protein n=1 Tax=Streptomyces cavernae TaxID=2259034 RepID=UPI00192E678B|nr:hypothetical protein [Streptomyces cavernae]